MSALLQAPGTDFESAGDVGDHKLVALVRRGDERAFETLYERYHRRIHAYVFGMVKDHQRAEDVTQEVFVSALRRMRATERPIAFKPWVYEIAKNACIDQFRRSKRAEEVSYDADEGLAPSDYGRLVSTAPVPDAALVAKEQLDQLCGAFGGLSEAHHQILVLRELEGLSYKQIGEKMGMSRPAVESTLFRARRRLTEEYDELASGQRCQRIQSIIVNASSGRLGARDTRRLARHVAHCQPCRREAVAAGVDAALVARKPMRQRAVEKVAALFPIPLLLRGRRGGSSSSASDGWASQLPVLSDHAAAGGAKLAAVAALVVAGLGAGVGTQVAPGTGGGGDRTPARPAKAVQSPAPQPAVGSSIGAPAPKVTESRSVRDGAASRGGDRRRERAASAPAGARDGAGARTPAAAQDSPGTGTGPAPAAGVGGGGGGAPATPDVKQETVQPSVPDEAPDAPAPPDTGGTGRDLGSTLPQFEPAAPETTIPQSSVDPVETLNQTVGNTVQPSVQGVENTVGETTSGATAPVDDAVAGVSTAAPATE